MLQIDEHRHNFENQNGDLQCNMYLRLLLKAVDLNIKQKEALKVDKLTLIFLTSNR